jgi:hypothetical protein
VAEAELEEEENDPVVLDTYVTDDEDDDGDQESIQSSDQTLPTRTDQEDPVGHSEGVTDDRVNEPVLIDLMPEDLTTSERIVNLAEEDQQNTKPYGQTSTGASRSESSTVQQDKDARQGRKNSEETP